MLILKFSNYLKSEYIYTIYDHLLSLCTSNTCNIRGYAQYFIYKLAKTKDNKINFNNENLLSKNFLFYLEKNPNIIKFFARFDGTTLRSLFMLMLMKLVILYKNVFLEFSR